MQGRHPKKKIFVTMIILHTYTKFQFSSTKRLSAKPRIDILADMISMACVNIMLFKLFIKKMMSCFQLEVGSYL